MQRPPAAQRQAGAEPELSVGHQAVAAASSSEATAADMQAELAAEAPGANPKVRNAVELAVPVAIAARGLAAREARERALQAPWSAGAQAAANLSQLHQEAAGPCVEPALQGLAHALRLEQAASLQRAALELQAGQVGAHLPAPAAVQVMKLGPAHVELPAGAKPQEVAQMALPSGNPEAAEQEQFCK